MSLQSALQQPDETPAASTPIPVDGSLDGKTCRRCGAANPPEADECGTCRSFLPGNQAARQTGLYARQQPAQYRMSADELMSGVVSDLGGDDNTTTLERSYVRKLGDLEILIRLLTSDIAQKGLLTPSGRVRNVHDKLMTALGTFDRYAQRIGTGRRQKAVDTLTPAAWLERVTAQRATEQEPA